MPASILIGLGAGLVSAVVFASAGTGPMAARVLLFMLTPLPLLLAGLGWRWTAAGIGALAASALLAIAASPYSALVFAATEGLPVVVLAYLAMLHRGAVTPQLTPATEWYPPGRLIVWTAVIAGTLSALTLLLMGGDLESVRSTLRSFFEAAVSKELAGSSSTQPLSDAEYDTITDLALALMPAAIAISWMAALLFNLWLAGRITLASGRLQRPWPDLATIVFPTGTPFLLAASTAASFAPGMLGLAAAGFAGSFYLAFVLLGLAVLHYTTRGRSWRPFALWGVYGALLLTNTGLSLVIAILGLVEQIFPLRRPTTPPSGGPPT
jgi:predicted membrane protein DUF2232